MNTSTLSRTSITIACLALASVAGCRQEQDPGAAAAAPAGPLKVYTTFYPTTYFAQRIGGEHAVVTCPVPADADPIFWRPPAETIGAYQRADLIIANGAGFEKWIETAALPRTKIVSTAASIEDEFLEIEATSHSHGLAGEHSHEGLDGHTWLDPDHAISQARAIGEALADAVPEHGEGFLTNFEDLESDLYGLDAELRELAPALSGVRLLASHPAYNYISRRYDWGITSFDLDPGEAISEEQLAVVLAEKSAEAGARTVMLWESVPLKENVAALRAIGVTSVVFSPAEMVTEAQLAAGEDYLSIMHSNIERLRAAATP